MQEEVAEKTIHLTIQSAKLSARVLALAMRKVLEQRKAVYPGKEKQNKDVIYKGKQTVKQLIGQNQGVSSIEITDQNIRSFDRTARKYGVDYAVMKDRSTTPPKYQVFFKAKDADALAMAFKEFSARTIKREQSKEKPSIMEQLKKFKEIVKANVIDKVKHKTRGERTV